MRVAIEAREDSELTATEAEEVLRWAMGGHVAEVQLAGVAVERVGTDYRCTVSLRLRRRRSVTATSAARSAKEALDAAAHRAGRALARRMIVDRILRG